MKELKRIGITGANGGVGSKVMEQEANFANLHLIPIVRNRQYIEDRIGRGEDVIEADLVNSSNMHLVDIASQVDGIIHLAATANEKNDYPQHMINNTLVTARLAAAAARMRIPFIYAGSIAQHTLTPYGTIDNNSKPVSEAAYGLSKNLAHEITQAIKMTSEDDSEFPSIQVLIGAVLGPDTAWESILIRMAKNPIASRLFLNSQLAWTDSEDLSKLLINMVTNPDKATTNRYIAVNGTISTNELVNNFSELAGVKAPTKTLPKKIVEPIARSVLRVAGSRSPITPEAFSFGLHGDKRTFVNDALIADYNWDPKSFDQTFEEIKGNRKI